MTYTQSNVGETDMKDIRICSYIRNGQRMYMLATNGYITRVSADAEAIRAEAETLGVRWPYEDSACA